MCAQLSIRAAVQSASCVIFSAITVLSSPCQLGGLAGGRARQRLYSVSEASYRSFAASRLLTLIASRILSIGN